VEAADGAGLLVDKRLHAERDAIDSGGDEGGKQFIGERAGGDLDGELGLRQELEGAADGGEEALQLGRRENAGRASAKVDGIEQGIEFGSALAGEVGRGGELLLQAREVAVYPLRGGDA